MQIACSDNTINECKSYAINLNTNVAMLATFFAHLVINYFYSLSLDNECATNDKVVILIFPLHWYAKTSLNNFFITIGHGWRIGSIC